MNHDTLSLSMFWVGLLFVLTPMVVAGVIIATIWHNRKKRRDGATSP
jgi:ACT domain-containing protein